MLNINKIDSDIHFNNLDLKNLSNKIGVKYTSFLSRYKKRTLTPDDIEKIADYFGRSISYYFDREGKEVKEYNVELKVQKAEEPVTCLLCAEKDKRIEELKEYISSLNNQLNEYKIATGKNSKAC